VGRPEFSDKMDHLEGFSQRKWATWRAILRGNGLLEWLFSKEMGRNGLGEPKKQWEGRNSQTKWTAWRAILKENWPFGRLFSEKTDRTVKKLTLLIFLEKSKNFFQKMKVDKNGNAHRNSIIWNI
jgi:hypothetical protein